MENKENNSAVDKVETVSSGENKPSKTTAKKKTNKGSTRAKSTGGSKQNPVKRTKSTTKSEKPAKTKQQVEVKEDKKYKREKMRVERDEAREKRKAELKQKKAERAEKRAALAAERKQAAIRKRENIKAEKLRKREERIARRDMLKNESKEARRDRIAAEKQEKYRLKREKAQIKAKLISEKRENRKLLKQQKREHRAANRSEKRSRGIGGWLAAVISLGCAVLLLGTLFTFNVLYMSNGNEMLNRTYEKAFYDLAGCVDNIDVNLSKLVVSGSPAQQQKLLTDIVVQSELAENQLQSLPLEDSSKYSTGKFINQLSDYSKTLSYKLADGGAITADDKEMLNEMYRRNSNLQQALTKISSDMGNKFSFLSLLKPEEDNVVLTNMNELENNSVEYPKMIYDGPFSDGLDRAEAKGLTGSEVTKSEALDNFNTLFADYHLTQAEVINECDGDIPTYNVQAMTERGESVYAQMTKRGGKLVMFNCYDPCNEERFTIDECRQIAEVFVKKAGFENMKPVWEAASRAVCQFNFAHEIDGVVVYSDLVKVNVCMERGVVSAIEATEYFLNHTERQLPSASVTAEQAENAVNSSINVQSVRKAIVPVGTSGERLAYEVFGHSQDGSQYFIYIDAETGREIEIFKVIQSTEGTVLI